jgi:hypothetical protein
MPFGLNFVGSVVVQQWLAIVVARSQCRDVEVGLFVKSSNYFLE